MKKEECKTLLNGIGGRITYKMKGPFVPLALEPPDATQKTQFRFTPKME